MLSESAYVIANRLCSAAARRHHDSFTSKPSPGKDSKKIATTLFTRVVSNSVKASRAHGCIFSPMAAAMAPTPRHSPFSRVKTLARCGSKEVNGKDATTRSTRVGSKSASRSIKAYGRHEMGNSINLLCYHCHQPNGSRLVCNSQ